MCTKIIVHETFMPEYLLDEKMQITILVLLLWSNSVYLQMDIAVAFTCIPSVCLEFWMLLCVHWEN